LKLVPKKTTKKYMRQLTYREVVLIKFWYFIFVSRRPWKTVGSTVVNTWWQRTFERVTEEEHDKNQCRQGAPFREPVLFSICWNLTLVGFSENISKIHEDTGTLLRRTHSLIFGEIYIGICGWRIGR
jgi:hypothetical protein